MTEIETETERGIVRESEVVKEKKVVIVTKIMNEIVRESEARTERVQEKTERRQRRKGIERKWMQWRRWRH